jgi:hypothetical protein
MSEFWVQVQPKSRCNVPDASRKLLFSVVFSLCWLQKSGTDPRSILIETAGPIFHVPFAVTHGLLTLYGKRPGQYLKGVELYVSFVGNVEVKRAGGMSVPFPLHWTENWKNYLTIYLRDVNPRGILGSLPKP